MIGRHSAGELRDRAINMAGAGANRIKIYRSQQFSSVAGRDSAGVKRSEAPKRKVSPTAGSEGVVPDASIHPLVAAMDGIIRFNQC